MKRFLLLSACISCFTMLTLAQAKYVFYFIGDGMGPNQVLAAEMYQAELEGRIGRVPLLMTQFPVVGMTPTFSLSNAITDSSAAGTCLASGQKTNNGMIGQTPDGTPTVSIATKLHNEGWGIGIVTTVPLDHATPSPFYAHTPSRDDYYAIGRQLAESGFDFFAGGGFHVPEDKHMPTSPNLYDYCEQNGYFLAGGYDEAKANMNSQKMILVPASCLQDRSAHGDALPFAIDREKGDLSLEQLVNASINYLSSRERFFIMVEGGKIDYSGHGNDAATNLHETIDFDRALAVAYHFYEQHPDETLIIVAADHETGGMALGNSDYTLNLQVLQHQRKSSGYISDAIKLLYEQLGSQLTWDDVRACLSKYMGLYTAVEVTAADDALLREAFNQTKKNEGNVKTLYKEVNALAATALEILNRYAHIDWSSHGHTATATPVFAIGVGAERFTGWYDNARLTPMIYDSTR